MGNATEKVVEASSEALLKGIAKRALCALDTILLDILLFNRTTTLVLSYCVFELEMPRIMKNRFQNACEINSDMKLSFPGGPFSAQSAKMLIF